MLLWLLKTLNLNYLNEIKRKKSLAQQIVTYFYNGLLFKY